MRNYQTHVFTSTYTADVSGVCSAMYELGGMSVIHDPSGCNSTYSTHDEPRWYEGNSLMFVSGLDEMTALLGDDRVIIEDIVAAAKDLNPRFITLCGGAMPHIIAFDYPGVARLIEKKCGIPVIPVATDGLKSYVSGVGKAMTAWIKRFADPEERSADLSVNLLGVTPLDFSVNGNAEAMRKVFEEAGIPVNCCGIMGEDFDSLSHLYRASVNVVVSSAGRRPARYMERMAGIPRVEGIPMGKEMAEKAVNAVKKAHDTRKSVTLWQDENGDKWEISPGQILVVGEEVFSKTLASAINMLPEEKRSGLSATALWPDVDEGFPEPELITALNRAGVVVGDPLFKVVLKGRKDIRFVSLPHEAYSGRIFRDQIPVFAGSEFNLESFIRNA